MSYAEQALLARTLPGHFAIAMPASALSILVIDFAEATLDMIRLNWYLPLKFGLVKE